MNTISPTNSLAISELGFIDRLLKSQLIKKLDSLQHGTIALDGSGQFHILGSDKNAPLYGSININNEAFYTKTALGGSVGAAESYMDGDWHSDQLVEVMRLLIRNRALLDTMESGTASMTSWLMKLAHQFRKNTKSGSRKNIAAHYDLGNQLFQLFLDSKLMYSSAVFDSPDLDLEQASERKLQIICEKLQLKSSDHLLEIGTGWGGMAIFAAKYYGCKVTTTTISKQQYEFAQSHVEAEGLQNQITLLFEDYRDLTGQYDKLVSIEMIEAIGHQFQDVYFKKCASLLNPGGQALIQAITIEDHRYQQALQSVDFIKRYIFPGSYIPCVSSMVSSAAQSGQLRLIDLQDIGDSYATTIHHWRSQFNQQREAILALGYDQRFIHMWDYYFAYCEAGFLEKSISDVHLLFSKAES